MTLISADRPKIITFLCHYCNNFYDSPLWDLAHSSIEDFVLSGIKVYDACGRPYQKNEKKLREVKDSENKSK